MTLFRGTVLDTPDDPFAGGALRAEMDAGVLVRDGAVVARGPFADVAARHADEEVVDLSGGLLLPGLVDTHVHLPQVRAIGGLGMPLLDWLDRCALPEEARLADEAYARSVASEFVSGLAQAGTTTALVFGSHFAPAVDALFAEASRVGLRVTSGLVVSDRLLRDELLTTPERAYEEGLALARRWHGVGRNRYAVTPRFSLSCDGPLLDSCARLLHAVDGSLLTSHINENPVEISVVSDLFGGCDYLETYDHHGLLSTGTVLAHNVHPTDDELKRLADVDAAVAHCPTSNCSLGSGLFPLRRHLDAGVRVALGSDVGAGTGFSLLKEGLQAYFVQQMLGEQGVQLTPAQLLHLSTSAGADALGLGQEIGDLSVGKRFDAVWLRPAPGTTFHVGLRHATDADDALAKAFALGTPSDVAGLWVDGSPVDR
jgi:guanine deaminase